MESNGITIGSGGTFGGLAVLYNCPRNATITAKGDATLWAADGKTFNQVLQDHTESHRAEYQKFLLSVPLLEGLPVRRMDRVIEATTGEVVKAGARVVTEGMPITTTYIVKTGTLKVMKGGEVDSQRALIGGEEQDLLKAGDCFGDKALLSTQHTPHTFVF